MPAVQPNELHFIRFHDALTAIGKEKPLWEEVFLMKYLNPMTDEEIAASLGVSEATAKRLYRDADRELLKRKGLPQKTSKFEDQNKLNN